MQILSTDFGPHSHTKWAVATAEMILPLDKVEDPERKIKAFRLLAAIADALEPHHEGVQIEHRASIADDAHAHFETDYDPTAHASNALTSVIEAAQGTPWADHFADRQVQAQIMQIVASHFATSHHIEKSWHADRNPDFEPGQAFKALHHTETVVPNDEPAA